MRGVLFDVDDTLVDHRGAQRRAIVAHLEAVRLPHGPDAVRRWRDAEERHFARHVAGELTVQQQRRERVRDVLSDRGGGDLTDAAADAWFAGYAVLFEAAWRAFDDVAAALDLLEARGVPIGIVSNFGADHQRRKLETVGLGGRFDVLVGLDTLGVGKPDPRVFLHACELIGSPPGKTAYVGDRLACDAIGARDAGLLAVWLDRAGSREPVPCGVVRVRSLDELEVVLS